MSTTSTESLRVVFILPGVLTQFSDLGGGGSLQSRGEKALGGIMVQAHAHRIPSA